MGYRSGVTDFHPTGEVATKMETGSIIGRWLKTSRHWRVNTAICMVADLTIMEGEYTRGTLVSVQMRHPAQPSRLQSNHPPSWPGSWLQVKVGETVEITRERDMGRAHAYTVEVIE